MTGVPIAHTELDDHIKTLEFLVKPLSQHPINAQVHLDACNDVETYMLNNASSVLEHLQELKNNKKELDYLNNVLDGHCNTIAVSLRVDIGMALLRRQLGKSAEGDKDLLERNNW